MADVPIYVAAITAAAGIIGAVIPQTVIVVREVRQAERDRRERAVTAARDACVDLIRAAGELGTLADNIGSYRGDANGMRARVEEVRNHAEAARLHAARVSFLAPGQLSGPADNVGVATKNLAAEVVKNTDLGQGVPVDRVDSGPLDRCVTDFRSAAVKYLSA